MLQTRARFLVLLLYPPCEGLMLIFCRFLSSHSLQLHLVLALNPLVNTTALPFGGQLLEIRVRNVLLYNAVVKGLTTDSLLQNQSIRDKRCASLLTYRQLGVPGCCLVYVRPKRAHSTRASACVTLRQAARVAEAHPVICGRSVSRTRVTSPTIVVD